MCSFVVVRYNSIITHYIMIIYEVYNEKRWLRNFNTLSGAKKFAEAKLEHYKIWKIEAETDKPIKLYFK